MSVCPVQLDPIMAGLKRIASELVMTRMYMYHPHVIFLTV